MTTKLYIGLSAVILATKDGAPVFLATRDKAGQATLPFGAFNPATDRTFELALRGWVSEQTGFPLGHVEQLYTFGDRDRDTGEDETADTSAKPRMISVGYLALTPEPAKVSAEFDAQWLGWYSHFPWEDHRGGRPAIINTLIAPGLQTWAAGNAQRLDRVRLAFALDGQPWIEERILERYELLYEAGLVSEAARDAGLPDEHAPLGTPMASDHRRILATAIARLRGKLKYRPVVFDLMGKLFTLSALQGVVEAVLGLRLHKQNFRRALDRTELVDGTGKMETGTGGRPAELYRFQRELLKRKVLMGVSTPTLKVD